MSPAVEKLALVIPNRETYAEFERGAKKLLNKKSVRLVSRPDIDVVARSKDIFLLIDAKSQLSPQRNERVLEFIRAANRVHHLKAIFLYLDTNILDMAPQILHSRDIRNLRNLIMHSDFELPSRVLWAWSIGAQKDLIAKAKVIDDKLYVQDCALEFFTVPFDRIPALKKIKHEKRDTFELPEDGSYIHWPEEDIHLNLDSIRYATDPAFKKKADHEKLVRNKLFGKAIATLRESAGLKQTDIKGLSERQIRRIEKGTHFPSKKTLGILAEIHEISLKDYLGKLAQLTATSTRRRGSVDSAI